MLNEVSTAKAGKRFIAEGVGYRDAMARLGAAVNIITSAGPGGMVGFTASAVCSVTDSPPTLLVCVNQSSSSHDTVIENQVLCVNTLSEDHEELSRLFSSGKPMNDRFSGASWSVVETGSPVLDDALVSFDCKVVSTLCRGTHTVLICEVVATKLHEKDKKGLMYFARRYHVL
jgi:flavin reductase